MTERLVETTQMTEDVDTALRPKTLDAFVGQKKGRENLAVFIEAARQRGDALDHVLLARRVWAKPHWRKSLPANWAPAFVRPPGR